MGIRIDDLVAPEARQQLTDFMATMESVKQKYVQICNEMIAGINIKVTVIGDLEKLDMLVRNGAREMVAANTQMQGATDRLGTALGNTTAQIAEELKQVAKLSSEQQKKIKVDEESLRVTDQILGDGVENVRMLTDTIIQMKNVSKEIAKLNKAYKDNGDLTASQTAKLQELIGRQEELKESKRRLTQIITNEQKMLQSNTGSYEEASYALERMKMALRKAQESDAPKEQIDMLTKSVQDLDDALKHQDEQWGQHQRHVGDYAIAANAGVKDTDALQRAIETEAKTSKEAAEQNIVLRDALERIKSTSPNAKEEINQLSKKIQENEKIIREHNKASSDMVTEMGRMLGLNSNLGRSFSNLSSSFSNGGNLFTGLTTKVKAFGTTLIGLLANPYVLAFLGIAGVAAGFKWWYDYNKGLIEASRQTKFFTGLTGDAMSAVRDKVQAVADTYGKDFADTLKAATSVSHNMGVTVDEALDLINKGFAAGGVNSEQYLRILQRFAPTMEKMGMSADQFVAFAGQIEKAGADTSKSMTAMGKASLQLRQMNLGTSQSLKSIGIDATQMSTDIQKGKKNVVEAMQEIAVKIKETGTNSREVADVMKNLFGARGESQMGNAFIDFLAKAKTGTDELLGSENSLARLKVKEVETQTELNNVIASLFEMGNDGFASMTTRAKIWIKEGLIKAIKWVVDLINYFIDWYNGSLLLRASVQSMIINFKSMFEICKLGFNLMIDAVKTVGRSLKGLGDILEGVLTFKLDKVKQGWNELTQNFVITWKEAWGDIKNAGANIGQAYVDGFNNAVDGKLHYINYDRVSSADTSDGYGNGDGSGGSVKNPTHPKDPAEEAARKAAERKRKQEEKAAAKQREQDLKAEEAMLEAMLEQETNYHKKEMLQIELQWTKKINAIKGNGKKEELARADLQRAMQHALAEEEYEYQKKKDETNMSNHLAAVKQGTEEEYILKLAQLEKQRKAELREAERTDADIKLINAKFIKQEQELLEEHQKNRINKIAETASTEQVIRDNALKEQLVALQEQEAKELAAVGNNEQKIADIKDRYARIVAEKQEQYAIESARMQLEAYKKQINELFADETAFDSWFDDLQDIEANTMMLEGRGMAHDEALNMAKQLAEAQIDIANAEADAEIAAIERVNDADSKARDKRTANAEKWLNAAADAIGNITSLVTTLFDGEIAKIEEQQEANQAQYDAQIANIEQLAERGAITQEEAELRKRAAEAATAKREEELAKKKAQAEYKQAVMEKANNVAQIAISTALGIMATYAKLGWPAGIPGAAFVAAMGAIQLATAIAQPIKAYKSGTDYHPGGPAIVGDGGRHEVVEAGGKYWLTPDVATLVTMPEGAKVFSDRNKFLESIANEPPANYGDMLSALHLPDLSQLVNASCSPNVVVNNTSDYRELRREVRELGRIMRAMTTQQHRDASRARYDKYRRDRL